MSDLIQTAKHWLEQFFEGPVGPISAIPGDASSRQYFRLSHEDKSYILMFADAIKENSKGFIEIARTLRSSGINVPAILDHDLNLGFILMNDLGEELYFSRLINLAQEGVAKDLIIQESIFIDVAVDKLYKDAIDSLLLLHQSSEPKDYPLPKFDRTLMSREIGLFEEWFLNKKCGLTIDAKVQSQFNVIFNALYAMVESQPQVFVHRDYHAGNLLVCPTKPGVIDFQDAVKGPITYDLVSLLLDRYISWPRDKLIYFMDYFYKNALEVKLISSAISFDEFVKWCDYVGLQRNLKIVGIFSRLELRDHKLGYQKFMPRFMEYVVTVCKAYPEFALLGEFMENIAVPRWEYLKTKGISTLSESSNA